MPVPNPLSDETKSNDSWQQNFKAYLEPISIEQAYHWAELLRPTLQEGVVKVKEMGVKAKGDMAAAFQWFNSMSATKQKYLVDMATGAALMTKDAVAGLTKTTASECGRVRTLFSEKGLSKAAQITAMSTLEKAQELYATVMSAASIASSHAVIMANLKREEFLASGSLAAAMAWAEATKQAVEESDTVKAAMEKGGDALTIAKTSYLAALVSAEEKRVEAVQLSSVYLSAAQEYMVAWSETEQGKRLKERTLKLLELTRQKTADLQEASLVKIASKQLEANYKLACKSVQAAQDWVTAVMGYQKEEKPTRDEVFAKQVELVSVLEKGMEGLVELEDRKPAA